jgi:thiamine biosynthesis protein ThiI
MAIRDTIVIHTSEICLKGANRGMFEQKLIADIARRLRPVGSFKVHKRQGSVIAKHDGRLTDAQVATATETLSRTFGIASFLFAARAPKTMDDIKAVAAELLAEHAPTTFKVFTRRSDKTFPKDSQETSVEVGGHLFETVPGVTVDVRDPKTEVQIEISHEEALVGAGRQRGPGGLPTGVSGRVVCLLSGGIDSPVAAWKAMRRGCTAIFVHFHSYPYVGRESVEKVRRLAAILNGWQDGGTAYYVPFGDVQREIVAKADPSMRVILYRRAMMRIAEEIAAKEKALGIVTGDCIGQVASQTLENLATVTAAATLPVYRPLIGEDKDDVVTMARRVGTFATSIEPHDDCCSVFMPPRPATRSTVSRAETEEAKCDLAPLVTRAVVDAERVNAAMEAAPAL